MTNGTLWQKTIAFVLSVIFWLFVYKIGHAANTTTLSPTRIVFDNSGTTIKEFTVTNSSNETVKYSLSLIDMRMKEDGKLEAIASSLADASSASKYLFVYPDRFELAPNESRTIKVRLTSLPAAGEYRSHLYVRKEKAGTAEGEAVKGVTMPIIIRSGELSANAAAAGISLKLIDGSQFLQLTVNRDGNMSLYGDINVSFLNSTGKSVNVASLKGTAIYTPNTQRVFTIKLDQQPGINYQSGKFQVEYAGSSIGVCAFQSATYAACSR